MSLGTIILIILIIALLGGFSGIGGGPFYGTGYYGGGGLGLRDRDSSGSPSARKTLKNGRAMPIFLYVAMWGAWMGIRDTRFGMPDPVPVKTRRRAVRQFQPNSPAPGVVSAW